MNNATKRKLKEQDQFISLTEQGIGWANENRQTAIVIGAVAVALILLLVGGFSLFAHRTSEARTAFGEAMQTYQTPVAQPGAEIPPGTKTFPDVKSRAAAANAQFLAVAHQYSMTSPGKLALYFAGLTYMDEGDNAQAESTLKQVAGSWNGDVAALAKLALAQLDEQTGQTDEAANLYTELSKGHATTVPPSEAQLELAEMYQAQGNTAAADQIYAKLKDKDKDARNQPGPAGEIAAQRLQATR